jgi:hypothetical protein
MPAAARRKGHATMTPYQKRIKTFIQDVAPVFADQIVCKKTGEIELKRGYFYTFRKTAEGWAASVEQALRMADIPGCVTFRDEWANWPKTSYFTAIVKEPQP